jgi:hypothetical protein
MFYGTVQFFFLCVGRLHYSSYTAQVCIFNFKSEILTAKSISTSCAVVHV